MIEQEPSIPEPTPPAPNPVPKSQPEALQESPSAVPPAAEVLDGVTPASPEGAEPPADPSFQELGANSSEPPIPAPPEAPPAPPTRPRRTGGCLLWVLFFLLLLTVAGAGGYWQLQQWGRRAYGTSGEHVLKIRPRTPTAEIARMLRREGLVEHDLLFLAWLKIQREYAVLQAGDYTIKTPISPRGLLERLRHGAFERTLTIPEGWTARQIAARLRQERWIADEKVWLALVAQPQSAQVVGIPLSGGSEGFCFPETYRLDAAAKPEDILRRMLTRFRLEWDRLATARRDPRAADLGTTQVVVLASMIEREARNPEEMPQIASVYLNRLKKGMKLQCCATVRYAMGGVWDRPLLYRDLKIDSPYNTYLHPGLPPGAIANPGRAALAAVLRPAPTESLFYVYAGNNHHVFSRSYAEHMKAVRAARRRNPREMIPEQHAE